MTLLEKFIQQGKEMFLEQLDSYIIKENQNEIYHQRKKDIEKKDYDSTAVRIQDYNIFPTHKVIGLANYFVPFVHKIKCEPSLFHNYFCYVDPTRKVTYNTCKIIDSEKIVMDHFTTVRLDLARKYQNSSAKINIPNVERKIEEIHNLPYQITKDTYGIEVYIKEYAKYLLSL